VHRRARPPAAVRGRISGCARRLGDGRARLGRTEKRDRHRLAWKAMGKASRTKRRATVRSARKSRGNLGWWALATVVTIAGLVGIMMSRTTNADAAPVAHKDNWHAAIGVNVCGQWLPNAPTFEDDEGIHTHGDGLIHIHPFLSRAAGDNATVGRYFKLGGWSANSDSFKLWDGTEHKTGDKCGDKSASVRWEV